MFDQPSEVGKIAAAGAVRPSRQYRRSVPTTLEEWLLCCETPGFNVGGQRRSLFTTSVLSPGKAPSILPFHPLAPPPARIRWLAVNARPHPPRKPRRWCGVLRPVQLLREARRSLTRTASLAPPPLGAATPSPSYPPPLLLRARCRPPPHTSAPPIPASSSPSTHHPPPPPRAGRRHPPCWYRLIGKKGEGTFNES